MIAGFGELTAPKLCLRPARSDSGCFNEQPSNADIVRRSPGRLLRRHRRAKLYGKNTTATWIILPVYLWWITPSLHSSRSAGILHDNHPAVVRAAYRSNSVEHQSMNSSKRESMPNGSQNDLALRPMQTPTPIQAESRRAIEDQFQEGVPMAIQVDHLHPKTMDRPSEIPIQQTLHLQGC